MPVQNNELLDDPIQFDRQAAFGRGQASDIRANLLSETHAIALENVHLDSDLVVEQRRGFRKFGDLSTLVGADTCQGLWWYDTPTSQYLLALAGGELYKCTSTPTWTSVAASASSSSTEPATAAQVVETFYLADGASKGKYWTKASLDTPAAGTALADAAPSTLGALTQMRFRMFGLDTATADSVYVSTFLASSGTPFTLGGSLIQPFRVGDGTGDPIVAMVPWRGLFSLVCEKAGSIWIVDTSAATASTTAATLTSAFGVQQVGWVGCAAPRTFVRASNDILFLASDGVRSLAKTIEDGEGELSEPLSKPIDDLIRRINTEYISTACAVFHEGKYLCAVPLDNSTVPNCILVFHARRSSWSVWTGVQPVAMVVAAFRGAPKRLCILDSRGHCLEYRDHPVNPVPSDFWDDVTGDDVRPAWRVRTRAFTWGDQISPKHPDHAEFEFDRSEAIVDVTVYADGDTTGQRLATHERTGFPGWILAPTGGTSGDYPGSTLSCTLGDVKVKRFKKIMTPIGEAREIAFEIREAQELSTSEETESGVLRMRSVIAGAFLETIPPDS